MPPHPRRGLRPLPLGRNVPHLNHLARCLTVPKIEAQCLGVSRIKREEQTGSEGRVAVYGVQCCHGTGRAKKRDFAAVLFLCPAGVVSAVGPALIVKSSPFLVLLHKTFRFPEDVF